MDDDKPISMFGRVKSNAFWGRRGGMYEPRKPKNQSNPWGNVFKIKRGSQNGGTSNSAPTGRRHTRFYQTRFGHKARAQA